jgi:hypothetical protein
MNAIVIGSLTLQPLLLAVVLGFLFAMAVMYGILRLTSFYKQDIILNLLGNAFLWIVLVWKFGPLLFSPQIIWEQPGRIIFIQGETRELWLGLLIAIIYILMKTRKDRILFNWLMDVLAFGTLAFMVPFHAVTQKLGKSTDFFAGDSLQGTSQAYHPIYAYFIVFSIVLFIIMWFKGGPIGRGQVARFYLLWFGLGGLIISNLNLGKPAAVGLSLEQLTYIIMVLGSLLWRPRPKSGINNKSV